MVELAHFPTVEGCVKISEEVDFRLRFSFHEFFQEFALEKYHINGGLTRFEATQIRSNQFVDGEL